MGPDPNHFDQIRNDAVRTTLRHFRDDMIDNNFKPVRNLNDVEKELTGTNMIEPAEASQETEKEEATAGKAKK